MQGDLFLEVREYDLLHLTSNFLVVGTFGPVLSLVTVLSVALVFAGHRCLSSVHIFSDEQIKPCEASRSQLIRCSRIS